MENVRACRLCLGVDVKLYDMASTSLVEYYELLTGTNFSNPSLLTYACYECAALLKKCYLFRQKSLRSHIVLDSIFKSHGKITEEHIRHINRKSLYLNSALSVQVIESTGDVIDDNLCFDDCNKIENLIKTDVNIDNDGNFENSMKEEENIFESNLYDILNDEVDFDWPIDEELHKTKTDGTSGELNEAGDEEMSEISISMKNHEKCRKSNKDKRIGVKKEKMSRDVKISNYNVDEDEFKRYVTVNNLSVEEQFDEVRRRQESKNYQNSYYKCELCYKGYIDKKAWENHLQQHNLGTLECDICKIRFTQKHSLALHLKRHSIKYQCQRCTYVSRSIHQAKRHILWHKGVTYTCPHCDRVFTQRISYRTHVRVSHSSDVVCEMCGHTFVSPLGLAYHKKVMHRDLEKFEKDAPYCEACDVKFATTLAHKRHLVTTRKHIEMSDDKHGCRECGDAFNSVEALRAHTKASPACRRQRVYSKKAARTPDPKVWPKQCPHCAKEIANAYLFWGHFRRCHPDKEYPKERTCICEVCGKGFETRRNLTWHMRSHTNSNEFKCSECGKVLQSRRALQQHGAVHSDARPHVCALCGMAFKTKPALDRHTIVHTGEKPYECSHCGKCFSQSNTCHQHVRTVHFKLPPLYVSRSKRERMKKKQEASLNT